MFPGCYSDVSSSYVMESLKSDSSCVTSTAFSSVPTDGDSDSDSNGNGDGDGDGNGVCGALGIQGFILL
jgi:hypothetical protein